VVVPVSTFDVTCGGVRGERRAHAKGSRNRGGKE
jgi:hypothetical protein